MILGWTLHQILDSGRSLLKSELIDDLESYVKDELADAKEKGAVHVCACKGYFRIDETEYGYDVYLEVASQMRKFKITLHKERIGDGNISYESIPFYEAIEGYNEMGYNEYKEDK